MTMTPLSQVGSSAEVSSPAVEAPRDKPAVAVRRVLAWLSSLLVLTVLGDRLLAIGLDEVLLESELRFSVLYRGEVPSGVLVLGDSRGVNCCYAPSLEATLERPVFNLSYNGLSTELAELLLLDYLDRNPAPSLLLLEISNLTVPSELIHELRLYSGVSTRVRDFVANHASELATAESVTHLYRYNNELFLRAMFYLRQSDQSWINRYRISAALLESTRTEEAWELSSLPENLAALRRILLLAKARGIEVRLVLSPYLPEHLERCKNLDDWIASVEDEVGVHVWNFAGAVTSTDGFSDRLHLNELGYREFEKVLVSPGMFGTLASVPR